MLLIGFLLLFLSFIQASQQQAQQACSGSCSLNFNFGSLHIHCFIQDNLNQMDLKCDNLIDNKILIDEISFFFRASKKLNQTIQFNTSNYNYFNVVLADLDEIHLDLNPFALKKPTVNYLAFFDTKFNFFVNGSRIASESDCNQRVFNNKPSIFKGFTKVQLSRINYVTKICPLIFQQAELDILFIMGQENLDNIMFMNSTEEIRVNAVIKEIFFDKIKSLSIRKQILNPLVFSGTRKIVIINSGIESIDSEAIGSLPLLTEMELMDLSFKDFYVKHKSFYKNPKNRKNVDSSLSFEQMFKDPFLFQFGQKSDLNESRDFCAFKDYPHDKCVLISPQNQQIECSNCLHLFLFLFNVGFKELQISCQFNNQLVE